MRISDFQKLIKNLYFHQDFKRGVDGTFIWLIEEVGELTKVLKNQKIDKEKASEELADIIAWSHSIANLLDINLEVALLKKYPNKCVKCNKNPCCCSHTIPGS